jgi:hypothetical protein
LLESSIIRYRDATSTLKQSRRFIDSQDIG